MLDKELAIMMKCLSLQNSAVCKVGISFLYNSMEYLLHKNDIPLYILQNFRGGELATKIAIITLFCSIGFARSFS